MSQTWPAVWCFGRWTRSLCLRLLEEFLPLAAGALKAKCSTDKQQGGWSDFLVRISTFLERWETCKNSFLSLHHCLSPSNVLQKQTGELLGQLPPPAQLAWSRGRLEGARVPPSLMASHTYHQQVWAQMCLSRRRKEHQESHGLHQPPAFVTLRLVLQRCKAHAIPGRPLQLLSPALTGPGGRHVMPPHLHSGLFAIFHSTAAFADCHLLTRW